MKAKSSTSPVSYKRGYRYTLEEGSKKHPCPECGHNRFVRYVDLERGNTYLPKQYGRCDREEECQYALNPYIDGYAKEQRLIENGGTPPNKKSRKKSKSETVPPSRPAEPPPSTIPFELFAESRKNYERNNFISFLCSVFEIETVMELIARYHIGTSKHWNGGTVFWQITAKGEIRGGKVMLYDDETGKRVKIPFNHITWVHKIIKDDAFILGQCFFGEHLLALPENDGKPVCIVESEKTAIIASGFVPDVIWLATGGIKNLNLERAKALGNRKVYLIPDLGAWDQWDQTVKKLNIYLPETHLILSDILQREASVPVGASDLADVLPLSPEKWIERIRQCILEGEKCSLSVVLSAEITPEKAIFAGETVLITPTETEKTVDSQKKDANKGEISILKSAEGVVSNAKKSEIEILPNADVKHELSTNRYFYDESVIQAMEAFFEAIKLPTGTVRLNDCSTTDDARKYVTLQLEGWRAINGKPSAVNFYNRLMHFKDLLTTDGNP